MKTVCGLLVLAATVVASYAADTPRGKAHDFVFLADTRPVLVRLHMDIDGKPLDGAWEEFVRDTFKMLDKNGDGNLDAAELKRLPPAQALFAMPANQGPVNMATVPAGPDGKVKLDDLKKFLRKNGGAAFQARYDDRGGQQARVIDFTGRLVPRPGGKALQEALFKLLDEDKDGKLSRAELARTPFLLLQKDANDDELLTSQELLEPTGAGAYGDVEEVYYDGRMATVAEPPFVLLTPEESARNLARRLLTRYGAAPAKKKMVVMPAPVADDTVVPPPVAPLVVDRKIAGTLTQKQIGLDDATFKQLDVDEDGKLDMEELAQFARRAPDVELVVHAGRNARLDMIKGTTSPLAAQLRQTKNGSVVLNIGTIRLEYRAESVPAGAATARRKSYLDQFKALDQDANGYLDRKEAQRSPFFRSLFNYLDENGDGKIFEKELLASLDRIEAFQSKARNSIVGLEISDQDQGLFDLLDSNRDGRLSVREMRNAVQLIDSLDLDGDGRISRSEIPRNFSFRMRPGPVDSTPVVNGPSFGRLRSAPLTAPEPTAGPLWFRKMDRNRDGDVSRREFLGSDLDFARIDADGDGLISADEAGRADKQLRK